MIDNPLLAGFQECRIAQGQKPFEENDTNWLNRWSPGGPDEFAARKRAIQYFGFAIPTDRALQTIVKYGPTIEMGAGLGYWAAQLRNRLAHDVLAYEPFPTDGEENAYWQKRDPWMPVERGGHEKLRGVTGRALLLIWPPYAEPMARECLEAFEGDTVIYVGEGSDGCTGDGLFHATLENEWHCIEEVRIPQWWGLHDGLSVHRRGRLIPERCECDSWRSTSCAHCWAKGLRESQKEER